MSSRYMDLSNGISDSVVNNNSIKLFITVKPVLSGISRVQNMFLLKPGFRLIKEYYDSHGT
jgi:hypothetical protein